MFAIQHYLTYARMSIDVVLMYYCTLFTPFSCPSRHYTCSVTFQAEIG